MVETGDQFLEDHWRAAVLTANSGDGKNNNMFHRWRIHLKSVISSTQPTVVRLLSGSTAEYFYFSSFCPPLACLCGQGMLGGGVVTRVPSRLFTCEVHQPHHSPWQQL